MEGVLATGGASAEIAPARGMVPVGGTGRLGYSATMALTCNIDQTGRKIRFFIGVFLETVGILLGVLWYLEWLPGWTIWPAAAIWISALFVIFEALVGWCAVRAMGFKTPF
jgi:hypothetical protein